MAVNLLVALVIFTVPVVSLNLNPPEFLGPYTDDPARWPYGGCVEVSKIYPAPGSHLLPPVDKYAQYWNLTVTVVFSRPVTRILWNHEIRTWLRNASLYRDREVQSCAKHACLIFVHNGVYIHLKAATNGYTERAEVFSDEYQFTFTVPTYVKDYMSEVHFALDGGWMYSPVYKFITNPHVEYVPYVAVRYLPPKDHVSSRPPERDTDYWVNYPITCAARGGLIHRPFIFSRTKRKQQIATVDNPKLLTELTEIVKVPSEGKQKLRLYYQLKQPGVYNVELPVSVKALNISFSVPAVKSLVINFTSPHLYIPLEETKYVFDYRERAYYETPRWIAYLFTWKVCRHKKKFVCNMFNYSSRLPSPSLHDHQVTFQSFSDGYKLAGTPNYGVKLILYHQFYFPKDKQYYFRIPQHLFQTYEFYIAFKNCLRVDNTNPLHYCLTTGWNHFVREKIPRNLRVLVLDPYWKLTSIFDKYTGEPIDHFMISEELPKTIYASLPGISAMVPGTISGMMQYSATGSLYEKDMSTVIPLRYLTNKFQYQPKRKLKTKCTSNVKRNVGKWGKLTAFIERGNMYQLHIPKSSSSWTVQQTLNVRYRDENDKQGTLNATIVSFPEHIKKAVERYAVLTNVQPNVYTAAQRDSRLRSARESYPLEKAVFVPRDLINKHGCGTLNITEDDIKQIRGHSICYRPPDDCTSLPFDSLDRFPLIPPFNVLDLIGPVDHMDASKKHYRRALYYRDNTVNDLFILNSPNSHYIGVVEISGVEVKDPVFVEKSCNDFWKFSPDRYEITRGHLMGTITNKGEGGSDVVVSVQCTPKLGVLPDQATVWVGPHQTKPVKFVVSVYPKDSFAVYKCSISTTIDVTPFSSAISKTFPTCDLFIPTFGGYFVDPCESYSDHDIIYYHLSKEFAHDFPPNAFLTSAVGKKYKLLEVISIKLVKYHTIRLSCDNDDVLALTEDQLITSSMNNDLVSQDIDLVYSIDKLLQERVYMFIRKTSHGHVKTGCLLTLISTPSTSCGVLTTRHIILRESDMHDAIAFQERKEAAKKSEQTRKSISERDGVLTAILVCIITSLVLIVLIITGRSALYIYDKKNKTEKKMEQIKAEMQLAKQEHKETWNNPRMYLKSGMLGPYYDLHGFKATDALDTTDLKKLKLTGVLKYRDKELQVVVEYIDKIVVKRSHGGKMPDEVWLRASTGMYLLKKNHVSEEYNKEFNSLLQRCMERNTRRY